MEQLILTQPNIMFILGILGLIFTVYRYFREPQIQSDKKDALFAQQFKFMTESTDKRFKDIQDNFQQLLLQSNNHIHTVDTKVDSLNKIVTEVETKLVELTTIINERIPKK